VVCNCKHESRSIMVSRLRIPAGLIKQTMAELRRLEGPSGKLFISSLSYRMRVINLCMPHLPPSSRSPEPSNLSHPSTHLPTKTHLISSSPYAFNSPLSPPSPSSSRASKLNGPRLTISDMTSYSTSAAAMVVSSALVS